MFNLCDRKNRSRFLHLREEEKGAEFFTAHPGVVKYIRRAGGRKGHWCSLDRRKQPFDLDKQGVGHRDAGG